MIRKVLASWPLGLTLSSTLMGISAGLLWAVGLSTLAHRMETRRG